MAFVLRRYNEFDKEVQKGTEEMRFEVGYYEPDGYWVRESKYEYPKFRSEEDAKKRAVERCHYLNGGVPDSVHDTLKDIAKSLESIREDQDRSLEALNAIRDKKSSIF